jgi:hypothetical protein
MRVYRLINGSNAHHRDDSSRALLAANIVLQTLT